MRPGLATGVVGALLALTACGDDLPAPAPRLVYLTIDHRLCTDDLAGERRCLAEQVDSFQRPPVGDWLSFDTADGLFVANTVTGEVRDAAPASNSGIFDAGSWSADGARLLYFDGFLQRWFVVRPEGGSPTALPVSNSWYDWSPAAARLAATTLAGDLAVCDLEFATCTTFPPDCRYRQFSADGAWVACTPYAPGSGFTIYDVTSVAPTATLPNLGLEDLGSLDWSPDTKYLSWIRHRMPTKPLGPAQLFIGRPDGTDARSVAEGGGDLQYRWSPDARRIAVVTKGQASILGPDGSVEVAVAATGSPLWTRDGSRVLLVGGGRLSMITPRGELTSLLVASSAFPIALSPTGRWAAAITESDQRREFLCDLSAARCDEVANDLSPRWGRDPVDDAFLAQDAAGHLRAVDPASGESTSVAGDDLVASFDFR